MRIVADDLAYLKNPIWWTGMVTSEHSVLPWKVNRLRLIKSVCVWMIQ